MNSEGGAREEAKLFLNNCYARYFTITHAQANYDHFIYADTDSFRRNGITSKPC